MNWDMLGALAELVAGAGVIATLAYVAVQMRQNTLSVRANTNQGLADAGLSFTQSVFSSEEVSRFLHKALLTE